MVGCFCSHGITAPCGRMEDEPSFGQHHSGAFVGHSDCLCLPSTILRSTGHHSHVLFTTLFASALGLVLYFLLWTVIKDAPLNVLANMQSGQINDVTIASIQWSHNFGKLTIVVDNPTDMDYQDLDLLIQPDVLVAEAAQKTQVNGVAIWRDNIHSISLDNIDLATQHRTNFNYEPIAANTGYRVKAAVFPARTHTEFVFALVTIKIGPPAPPNPFDPNYVIQIASHSNETGEKFVVWFGSTKHTDAVFDNPPNIEKVKVKGHYTSQQIERRLDINMPVSDLTRDAVQQILKQQRQP